MYLSSVCRSSRPHPWNPRYFAFCRLPNPSPVDFRCPPHSRPFGLWCTKQSAELPFSGAFPQSIEVLLPGNFHQFGSNKLINILTSLNASPIDKTVSIKPQESPTFPILGIICLFIVSLPEIRAISCFTTVSLVPSAGQMRKEQMCCGAETACAEREGGREGPSAAERWVVCTLCGRRAEGLWPPREAVNYQQSFFSKLQIK